MRRGRAPGRVHGRRNGPPYKVPPGRFGRQSPFLPTLCSAASAARRVFAPWEAEGSAMAFCLQPWRWATGGESRTSAPLLSPIRLTGSLPCPGPPPKQGWGGAQAEPLCSQDWGLRSPRWPPREAVPSCASVPGVRGGQQDPLCVTALPGHLCQFPLSPAWYGPGSRTTDWRDGRKLPSSLTPADPGGEVAHHPHLRAAFSCGHHRPMATLALGLLSALIKTFIVLTIK